MSIFVTSTSSSTRHGVFIIKATPGTQVVGRGTGVVGVVGDFPWGPDDQIFEPASLSEALETLAPQGMSRSGYAYLQLATAAWPALRISRVLGSGAAKATATLTDVTPDDIATVTLKYKGAAGNACVATVSAASDGDTNHFDLTVTVTSTTGTTTDTIRNINFSGTGDDTVLTATQKDGLKLIGDVTKVAAGRPLNGDYTFSSGSDGTVSSTSWLGTPGNADQGLARLEGDKSIRHVFCTYPGSGSLSAVNAGLVAFKNQEGTACDVFIAGPSGQTPATARTDAANYRSYGVFYIDPWTYVRDTAGNEHLIPGTGFAASVAAQLPPSTSIAWKAQTVRDMLQQIVRLEYARGAAAGTNTDKGICTLVKEEDGGHTFEADVTTAKPVDENLGPGTNYRMDVYIATALQESLRSRVDAPNVPANRNDLTVGLFTLLSGLKNAQRDNPDLTAHIVDFSIRSVDQTTTAADIAQGKVVVEFSAQFSSGMSKIFFVQKTGTSPLVINGG